MIEHLIASLTSHEGIVGLSAMIIVLVSMCFNTRTRTGTLWMRSVNIVGCLVSIYQGILLDLHRPQGGITIILLNLILIFINGYYFIKSWRQKT